MPGENLGGETYFGGSFKKFKHDPYTYFYYEHVYKASYPELCYFAAVKTKTGYDEGSYYCKGNAEEPYIFYETFEAFKP